MLFGAEELSVVSHYCQLHVIDLTIVMDLSVLDTFPFSINSSRRSELDL